MLDDILKYSLIVSAVIFALLILMYGKLFIPFIPFLDKEPLPAGEYPFVIVDVDDKSVKISEKKEIVIVTNSNIYLDRESKSLVNNLKMQTIPVKVVVRSDSNKRNKTLKFFKELSIEPLFAPKFDEYHKTIPRVYIVDRGSILFEGEFNKSNFPGILAVVSNHFNVIDYSKFESYGIYKEDNSGFNKFLFKFNNTIDSIKSSFSKDKGKADTNPSTKPINTEREVDYKNSNSTLEDIASSEIELYNKVDNIQKTKETEKDGKENKTDKSEKKDQTLTEESDKRDGDSKNKNDISRDEEENSGGVSNNSSTNDSNSSESEEQEEVIEDSNPLDEVNSGWEVLPKLQEENE